MLTLDYLKKIKKQTPKAINAAWAKGLLPPPPITVSEWADANRVLPSTTAEPGPWRTDRVPYMREIMDCLSVLSPIRRVSVMKGAQLAFTEAGLNWMGYVMDNSPGLMLLVMPTMDTVKRNTRTRIDPMIESTPCLSDKLRKHRLNEAGNTSTAKRFTGGELVMCGANSAAPLRSTPARYIFLDEVDGYPADVDKEGDPVDLAIQRNATFVLGKVMMGSTPTVKNLSRIEKAYKQGDQRRYYVPCIHCDELQVITWEKIRWEKEKAERAYFVCEFCGGIAEEYHKPKMLAGGKWIAENPNARKDHASFWISTLYSPFESWGEIALSFLEVKDDPTRLKSWTNLKLAETWDEGVETVEPEVLFARSESWESEDEPNAIPEGVMLITVGVDVQGYGLEVETVGWGKGEENWSLDFSILDGDPTRVDVWAQLDDLIARKWSHPVRGAMGVAGACVDSGGHHTTQVINYCSKRTSRRIWAIKGVAGQGKPAFPRAASKTKREKMPLYIVGVDTIKEKWFKHLAISKPGPGYCHFPDGRELRWFQQIVSEQLFITMFHGRRKEEWRPKPGVRQEGLDCRVYAYAALEGLKLRGVWRAVQVDIFEKKKRLSLVPKTETQETVAEMPAPQVAPPLLRPNRPVERNKIVKKGSVNRPGFLLGGRPGFF